MRPRSLGSGLVAVVVALAGCSGGSDGDGGGGGPIPAIAVAPRTATVTAGGAGVTFTATLSGGATGTITWGLGGGPGTLAPTTGPTTAYTPPAAIAAATAVTVTATAGALGASATVTVLPAGGGAVAGVVLDGNGAPLSGVDVAADGGAPVTTGADGAFALDGVSPPYQLAAVWNGPGFVVGVVLDGLGRTDPVVQIPAVAAGPLTSHGTFEGVVTGPPLPYPTGSAVLFSAGAPEVTYTLGAVTDEATGACFGEVEWLGTQALSAVLHAMYVDDPLDPTEYWHGTRSLALDDLQGATGQDLTLSRLATGTLSVTVTLPADCLGSGTCAGLLAYAAEFADGASFDGGADPITTSPETFVSVTPELAAAGGSLSLSALSGDTAGAESAVFRAGVPATATVSLSPRVRPVPAAPADGATGVGPGSTFSWTSAAFVDGIHELHVARGGVVPRDLWVYTEATSFVLPDLAALGFQLPPGAPSYTWSVVSSGPAALDDLAGGGAATPATWYVATSVERTFSR
jgi:hypothetical protein